MIWLSLLREELFTAFAIWCILNVIFRKTNQIIYWCLLSIQSNSIHSIHIHINVHIKNLISWVEDTVNVWSDLKIDHLSLEMRQQFQFDGLNKINSDIYMNLSVSQWNSQIAEKLKNLNHFQNQNHLANL